LKALHASNDLSEDELLTLLVAIDGNADKNETPVGRAYAASQAEGNPAIFLKKLSVVLKQSRKGAGKAD